MQGILITIAAAIIVWVGVVAYNSSAGERRMMEARAYAIEAQADADASATRWMAMYPALMIVGGTIVGVVFGVGFITAARRPRPAPPQQFIVEKRVYLLPPPARPEFLNALSAPSYMEIEVPSYEK